MTRYSLMLKKNNNCRLLTSSLSGITFYDVMQRGAPKRAVPLFVFEEKM